MSKVFKVLVLPLLVLVLLWAGGALSPWGHPGPFHTTRLRERLEAPPRPPSPLEDDRLEEKHPRWDEARVHPVPVGPPEAPWELNLSAAVTALDMLPLRSDAPRVWRELHPSPARAIEALEGGGLPLLPSVNVLSARAKALDDELMACLDELVALGPALDADPFRADAATLIRSLAAACPTSSSAHPWLMGALAVGGFLNESQRQGLGAEALHHEQGFLMDESQSKVLGFYEGSEALRRSFRFLRYLGQPWGSRHPVPEALAELLVRNPDARSRYEALLLLYTGLSNPFDGLSLLPFLDEEGKDEDLASLWREGGFPAARKPRCHFLPPSRSPENELIERLSTADLARERPFMERFVEAIRQGRLDLSPSSRSGWYDHQLHAMEALLLPERNPEAPWLLLSRRYKERMLQAFQVAVTRIRETHVRQLSLNRKAGAAPPPVKELRPRLRVEPNPTWFLRMARSYGFIRLFLASRLPEGLAGRLRLGGDDTEAPRLLFPALDEARRLFYGLHLLSCEDLGAPHALLEDEAEDREACKETARSWLSTWKTDPLLKQDSRVAVPVQVDLERDETIHWLILGIRGARLHVRWARPPRWRPAGKNEEPFRPIPSSETTTYVLLVEDFGEVRHPGTTPLSRKDYRSLCNRLHERKAILEALGGRK